MAGANLGSQIGDAQHLELMRFDQGNDHRSIPLLDGIEVDGQVALPRAGERGLLALAGAQGQPDPAQPGSGLERRDLQGVGDAGADHGRLCSKCCKARRPVTHRR